jgi:hypothetical protein
VSVVPAFRKDGKSMEIRRRTKYFPITKTDDFVYSLCENSPKKPFFPSFAYTHTLRRLTADGRPFGGLQTINKKNYNNHTFFADAPAPE